MEIHRSLGVSRLVALMVAHRHRSAHDRLLGKLDRLIAEARDLCMRAEELCQDGSVAEAFQTVLARPTRDWMDRAETVVATVRSSNDTICGARAKELGALVDSANVAMMRQPPGREAWRSFSRSVTALQIPAQNGSK
jgi:hypothetical protein